jgi:GT2 family glycosyltransferase
MVTSVAARQAPGARVGVIVVNANAGEVIDRALTAVAAQTVRPARTIVVDNASTDGSLQAVRDRHPEVEVIALERNVGFAAGNNVGFEAAADCDWYALLNPDAFPEPTWLEELLAAAERQPDYTFFGSRMLRATAPEELDGAGDAYHVSGFAWRVGHGRPAAQAGLAEREIFSPCAAAALYRRDAVSDVGGFDERFFCYFEDLDLAFRLRLRGHRCLYVPQAVVHHVGSLVTGVESAFTVYHSHRNLVWTYVKNMPAPLVWLYLPQHLLVNAAAVAWYASRGQGRAIVRALRDAVRGLPQTLRERRRVQAGRAVEPGSVRAQMVRGVRAYAEVGQRARLRRRADDEQEGAATEVAGPEPSTPRAAD